MKQVAVVLALMAVTPMVIAENTSSQRLVLDKVFFQIASKQWVTTQTALLSVSINVTLNNADLVKARSELMTKLGTIAKADWHLLAFDRSQDSSGLEKLAVQAQARVNQTALTDIYKNAKAASVPGAQYEISGVEFKPSLEETQVVRSKVREQLYQQVNEELVRINKQYPTQQYSINKLEFVEGNAPVQQPRNYQAKAMNTLMMAGSPASLAVSNELILTAVVEAGSNRINVTKGN